MSTPHPPRDPYWCDPHEPSRHPLPRDGRRNCGVLERVIRRQWDPAQGLPPADLIHVIDRLATLPADVASRLAAELDGLWVGDGNVPDLDALQYLKGVPVRAGSMALWDQTPGAVVGQILAVGTGDHLSASLIDHEIGHAIESFDQMASAPDWQTIMYRCGPILEIGRYTNHYEWWAEAWALVSTGQLTRLVRALGGHREVAEMIWAYYRHHYGLEVTQR